MGRDGTDAPVLRLDWDLRKKRPYGGYDQWEWFKKLSRTR